MDLQIRGTTSKGRGVFACNAFKRGDIVETVPVIVIPAEQWDFIEPTVLEQYIFNFGPQGEHAAIALGYGSIYNHSYSPNAHYVKSWEEQLMRFVALRDIEPDEEITVNYNGSAKDHKPVDFDVEE